MGATYRGKHRCRNLAAAEDTIPAAQTPAGVTMTAGAGATTVTIAGLTKRLFGEGDYLYDSANSEIRLIEKMNNDLTIVTLETGFTNAQAAAAVKFAHPHLKEVEIIPTGATTLDGGTMVVNQRVPFSNPPVMLISGTATIHEIE